MSEKIQDVLLKLVWPLIRQAGAIIVPENALHWKNYEHSTRHRRSYRAYVWGYFILL